LAQRDTFKAFQLWKDDKLKLISETTLEKFHKEKSSGELIAKITKRASPSIIKWSYPKDNANREVRRAAETSPTRISVECNRWVAAIIILPEESLMTTAVTAKESLIATSKFHLIPSTPEGVQKEGLKAAFQASRWRPKVEERCIISLAGSGWRSSCTNLFRENQITSKVREAKSWNFLASDLGMAKRSTGYKMARIQSEIGLSEKPIIISGQEEDLHRILARSQSKKIWHSL
jgi:hypothetical protein